MATFDGAVVTGNLSWNTGKVLKLGKDHCFFFVQKHQSPNELLADMKKNGCRKMPPEKNCLHRRHGKKSFIVEKISYPPQAPLQKIMVRP